MIHNVQDLLRFIYIFFVLIVKLLKKKMKKKEKKHRRTCAAHVRVRVRVRVRRIHKSGFSTRGQFSQILFRNFISFCSKWRCPNTILIESFYVGQIDPIRPIVITYFYTFYHFSRKLFINFSSYCSKWSDIISPLKCLSAILLESL